MIAELVVKEILAHYPGDVRIINVADDFGVLARTKRDALALQSALTRTTVRSPVGRFHLRYKANPRPRRVCDGFDFLGYRFRKRGSHVLCEASETNFTKFKDRVIEFVIAIERGNCNLIKQLRRYIKSWCGSFPLMKTHIRPRDYFWGRHYVCEVVRVNRFQAVGLATIITDWDDGDFAPLPQASVLTDLIRTIRRKNPEYRSIWMTGGL